MICKVVVLLRDIWEQQGRRNGISARTAKNMLRRSFCHDTQSHSLFLAGTAAKARGRRASHHLAELSTATTTMSMMAASSKSIGIVGAGIGGLTAATALKQKGFFVKVYEQASHFVPRAGAGFGFSPNGQVCLKSIGIETRPLLHPFDKLVHVNKEGIPRAESDVFSQIRERHGFGLGGCLRADLVDTLKESLVNNDDNDEDVLLYSHKLVGMNQDEDAVHLEFDNGQQHSHDLVIGADGIHSQVAQLLKIDDSPPIYSGANIFYGIIEEPGDVIKEIGLPLNAVVQVSKTK